MLVLWSQIWAGYILAFVAETKWSWLFPPSLWTVQYNLIFLPLVLFLCWNLLSWITHHWCLSCMVQNSMKLSLTSLRAKFILLAALQIFDSCGPWEWSYGSLSKRCEVWACAWPSRASFPSSAGQWGAWAMLTEGPTKYAACARRN
jgi:hypothetical protein